jgi:hypothetical protein
MKRILSSLSICILLFGLHKTMKPVKNTLSLQVQFLPTNVFGGFVESLGWSRKGQDIFTKYALFKIISCLSWSPLKFCFCYFAANLLSYKVAVWRSFCSPRERLVVHVDVQSCSCWLRCRVLDSCTHELLVLRSEQSLQSCWQVIFSQFELWS